MGRLLSRCDRDLAANTPPACPSTTRGAAVAQAERDATGPPDAAALRRRRAAWPPPWRARRAWRARAGTRRRPRRAAPAPGGRAARRGGAPHTAAALARGAPSHAATRGDAGWPPLPRARRRRRAVLGPPRPTRRPVEARVNGTLPKASGRPSSPSDRPLAAGPALRRAYEAAPALDGRRSRAPAQSHPRTTRLATVAAPATRNAGKGRVTVRGGGGGGAHRRTRRARRPCSGRAPCWKWGGGTLGTRGVGRGGDQRDHARRVGD